MKIGYFVLMLICVRTNSAQQDQLSREGFLREFFDRFPHLPFVQFNPNAGGISDVVIDNDVLERTFNNYHHAYAHAVSSTDPNKVLKRELNVDSGLQQVSSMASRMKTTAATTRFTTTSTTTTTASPVPKVPHDDIWFGNTPSPMYRGYVDSKIKPNVLKLEKKMKPKFIQALRTLLSEESTPVYYPKEKDSYPFQKFETELEDPPYMTDPHFQLPPEQFAFGLRSHHASSPYAVTRPTVKPHESKSMSMAHPDPQEVKSLPEMPTSLPLSVPTTSVHLPPLPSIVTTQAPKIKPHGEPTITFDQFKTNYFGPLKGHGLPSPPTVPTTPPPVTTSENLSQFFGYYDIQKYPTKDLFPNDLGHKIGDFHLDDIDPGLSFGYFELDPVQDLDIKQKYNSVFRKHPKPHHEQEVVHLPVTPEPFSYQHPKYHEDHHAHDVIRYPSVFDQYQSVFRKTPKPIVHDDPYAIKKPRHDPLAPEVNHYHFGHKQPITHIPLKYPIQDHHLEHEFEDFFGHPGDKIQEHILAINDPWLPEGAPLLTATASPPRLEPYKELDVSHLKKKKKPKHHYDDYEFFDHENYDDYDYDIHNGPQGPGFTLSGTNFEDNFKNIDVLAPSLKSPDHFLGHHKSKHPFVPSLLLPSTPKPHHKHKPAHKHKHKHSKAKKPKFPALKTTLKPFVNLLTTLNPFHKKSLFKKRPTKAPIKKTTLSPLVKKTTPSSSFLGTPIPSLGDVASGYRQFIDNQGKSAMGLISGLFGSNEQSVQRRNGNAHLPPFVKANIKTINMKSPSTTKTNKVIGGGHKELTRLEEIKLLLKEARDRPLL